MDRIDRTEPRGIGWCVRELNRILARTLQNRLEQQGLTLGQYHLLQELWNEDGLSQLEISTRLDVAEPWTVTSVNAMVAGGIVRRLRKKEDRRFAYIHLTAKGRSLKYVLVPHALAVNDIACAGFAAEEIEHVKAVLMSMRENLEKYEQTTPPLRAGRRSRVRPA